MIVTRQLRLVNSNKMNNDSKSKNIINTGIKESDKAGDSGKKEPEIPV